MVEARVKACGSRFLKQDWVVTVDVASERSHLSHPPSGTVARVITPGRRCSSIPKESNDMGVAPSPRPS